MSENANRMIRFEEDNWQDLAEKFIKKYESEWIDFVSEQYDQHIADIEPPDHYNEENILL